MSEIITRTGFSLHKFSDGFPDKIRCRKNCFRGGLGTCRKNGGFRDSGLAAIENKFRDLLSAEFPQKTHVGGWLSKTCVVEKLRNCGAFYKLRTGMGERGLFSLSARLHRLLLISDSPHGKFSIRVPFQGEMQIRAGRLPPTRRGREGWEHGFRLLQWDA